MNILAIDPGPEQSALVWWNGQRPIRYELISSERLTLAITRDVAHVACEHLQCFGMAVGREVFETAYFVGELRAVCGIRGVAFHRIYRSEVKTTLCHSMRATDSNIRQAIIDRFGGKDKAIGWKKWPGPLYGIKADLWSALAVAITFQETHAKQ